ncbi:MAG: Rha family transcriptional regulator [Sarcina sp.]
MREVISVNTTSEEIVRISSREVAIMMETEHKLMLRKIDNFNNIFNENNIVPVDYWVESKYVDTKGESRREYQISKDGCEFIANKSIGEKGIIFTHKYMQKFKEMEQQLKSQVPQISEKEQMLLKLFSKDPSEVAQAHNRIVEIEVEEATTPLIATIEVQAPKVDFHDTVTQNDTEFDAAELSKTLNFKRMGRNNLIALLKAKKVLDCDKELYQTYIDRGYGRVV